MHIVGSPVECQTKVLKNNMSSSHSESAKPTLIEDVVMVQLNRPEVQLEALQMLRAQRSPLSASALQLLGLLKSDAQKHEAPVQEGSFQPSKGSTFPAP